MKDDLPDAPREFYERELDGWEDERQRFLYAFHCEGFHKVGITRTPRARRASIQMWNPHPVTLVLYRRVHAKRARKYEMTIHGLLAPYRVHGEWFTAPLPVIRKAADMALRQMRTPESMEKFKALCALHPGRERSSTNVRNVAVDADLFDAEDIDEPLSVR